MNKVIITLAATAFASASFAQTTLYDSTNDSQYIFTSDAPGTVFGEGLTLASGGYNLSSLLFTVYNPTSGTSLSSVTTTVDIYDDTSGLGPTGDTLLAASTNSWSLAGNYYDLTVNFGTGTVLPQNIFITQTFTNPNTGVTFLTPVFGSNAPTVGTPSAKGIYINGSYYDAGDSIIYKIAGTAAPEPVSMTFLGLGAVGIIARKRRQSK